MRSPLKRFAVQFVEQNPLVLLLGGTAISLLASTVLFSVARHEGVLRIRGGVGFLQNYGLLSTLLANAVLPYLTRLYYDQVGAISRSAITVHGSVIQKEMLALNAMVKLEGEYARMLYFFIFIGLTFCISNASLHILGNSELRWGFVFDSLAHKGSFLVNRINNVYTWALLIPFCGYVVIVSSIQLARAIRKSAQDQSIKYDLLNPDRHGGFASVERTHVIFNLLLAIVYLQIVLYTTTFSTVNFEHVLSYIGITLVFLFGNNLFLGDTYRQIKRLKVEALNACKDRVYSGDNLQFQILKYCYDHRPSLFSAVNLATKAVTVIISLAVKLAPLFLNNSTPLLIEL
jgi:hypothetical protein